MSVYLQIDDTVGPIQIASNAGYGEFGDWVDSLDVVKYHDIVCLYEYGWCQNVANLIAELDRAIADDAPTTADVMDVATTLAEWLEGEDDAIVATITDGFGHEGDEGEDEDGDDSETKSLKDAAHAPAGSPQGGQFVSQGGSGGGEAAAPTGGRLLNILEGPLKLEHSIVHAVKGAAGSALNYVKELATGKMTPTAEASAKEAITAPAGTITKISHGVAMVAKGGVKAYMVSWIAGNKAVELVARAKDFEVKGLSESEVSRVKACCAGYDILACKPVMLGLELAGAGHLAAASTMIPLASCCYLAHAAVTNPIAVCKAAKDAVKSVVGKLTWGKAATGDGDVQNAVGLLCDAAKAHAGDDWFFACLPEAIEMAGEHGKGIADAIALAEAATKETSAPKDDAESKDAEP